MALQNSCAIDTEDCTSAQMRDYSLGDVFRATWRL